MTDFHTGGMEQSVTLEGGQMAKLLRYIVHTLEIFMWEQDYSLRPDAEDYDPFLDGEEGFFKEDLEDRLEIQPPKEPEGSPSWRVQVEYTNHTPLFPLKDLILRLKIFQQGKIQFFWTVWQVILITANILLCMVFICCIVLLQTVGSDEALS